MFWKKKSSSFEPDFCPVKLEDDPWIVQPTEHYEELTIEDIIKKIIRASGILLALKKILANNKAYQT